MATMAMTGRLMVMMLGPVFSDVDVLGPAYLISSVNHHDASSKTPAQQTWTLHAHTHTAPIITANTPLLSAC